MAAPRSVDDYIAARPAQTQRRLGQLRAAIRRALPAAEEVISHGMPTYRLEGVAVVHFAGWTQYCSMYPANAGVVAALGDEIGPWLAQKSTLRFPHGSALPVDLIARVARLRARQVTGIDAPG